MWRKMNQWKYEEKKEPMKMPRKKGANESAKEKRSQWKCEEKKEPMKVRRKKGANENAKENEPMKMRRKMSQNYFEETYFLLDHHLHSSSMRDKKVHW